jgi:hypothetical protein
VSLAFWLLLVVWALLCGTLGYAIRDPAALGEILGVRANDVVGLLLLALAVVGLLAYGAGRSR